MDRRLFRLLIFVGFGISLFFHARSAHSAPKDAAALKLDRDAIYNDYLATKFAKAEIKLRKAIAMCGRGACSPRVIAQLHRDLGVVYVVENRNAEATAEFGLAIQADPTITLERELTTPEIQAVFSAAVGGGAPAGASGADVAAPPSPAAAGDEDMLHGQPAEQTPLTPVPIYAEMPEGVTPAKVQVRYKPFGSTEWKTIELKKMRGGYGGEIPCLDIGSETGDLKYYIQAIDSSGDIVATSGTRAAPHKVPIKHELAGEPPHLPGKPPPAQCANPGDCPPGLPGCVSEKKRRRGDKEWGSGCEADSECQSGKCHDGSCASEDDMSGEAKTCTTDGDCSSGQVCSGGFCGAKAKKNFLSISIQQDMLLLSSAADVCFTQTDYSCYYSDNSQYEAGRALPNLDQVSGGFGVATTRVLVGFDRLFGENVTLGVKVGYAFNGGPAAVGGKSFFPFHGELRLAYFFGKSPFASTGLRVFATVNGGMAQIDSRVTVQVNDPNQSQGPLTLAAWKKTGTSFAGAGLGLMWLTSPGSGFVLEARLQQMFGSAGTGLGLQLGYAIGL